MGALLKALLKLLRSARTKPKPKPALPKPKPRPKPHTGPRQASTTPGQLQKKYKHAKDFGVDGNFNKANAAKFDEAIQNHVKNPNVTPLNGTYRGEPVVHYVDPKTGLNVVTKPNGEFVSGWKLNPDQLKNVLDHGGL